MPVPKSLIILSGSSEQKQLPTIRSRCQIVRFQPLAAPTVAELLLENGWAETAEQADRLASFSEGRMDIALRFRDAEMAEFRSYLSSQLAMREVDLVDLVKHVTAFVDSAGKEASERRARVRNVAEFAAEFYRQLMRSLCGLEIQGDDVLRRSVAEAHARWQGDAESAADCLERCLETIGHVDANANQATLLECWFDDLWLLAHGMTPTPLAV